MGLPSALVDQSLGAVAPEAGSELADALPAQVQGLGDGLEREVESSVHILNDLVDPATHTVEVRLLIPNPDLAIKPGLFVKAELEPAPRTVRVVERGAVLGFGEERYLFVEQDGRAVRKPVRVRDLNLLWVEVLAGVESGERALIGPALPRVTDGATVQVRASASETPRVAL